MRDIEEIFCGLGTPVAGRVPPGPNVALSDELFVDLVAEGCRALDFPPDGVSVRIQFDRLGHCWAAAVVLVIVVYDDLAIVHVRLEVTDIDAAGQDAIFTHLGPGRDGNRQHRGSEQKGPQHRWTPWKFADGCAEHRPVRLCCRPKLGHPAPLPRGQHQ